MKGKVLTGKQKTVYDSFNELKGMGITTTELKSHKDFYYFYVDHRKSHLLIRMPLDKNDNIWKVEEYGIGSNKEVILIESENWSNVLLTIIKDCYSDNNINDIIKDALNVMKNYKQEVIDQDKYIKNLENIKKYLEINN